MTACPWLIRRPQMRRLLVASATLLVLGAAALDYGLTRGRESEWHAGNLPYPGNGFTSLDEFHLYRGGTFELQVLSPCTPQERSNVNEEVVPSNLRVVIHGTNGFRLEQVLTSLRVGSWGESGRTFNPGDAWTLPRGDYEIRVEGRDVPPAVFRDRGAAIYLERMEPVGPDIGIRSSTYVGYALLSLAVILIVSCAMRVPNRRSALPEP
jgi:hypothetical protein